MFLYYDIVPKKGFVDKASVNGNREKWSLDIPSKSKLNNSILMLSFKLHFCIDIGNL